jgi:putative heme transporter
LPYFAAGCGRIHQEQPRWKRRMSSPNPSRRDSAWEAVPWLLRVGGLAGLCLVAVAAAVWVVGKVFVAVSALSVALAVAVLLAAVLQPVTNVLRGLRAPAALAALGGVLTLIGAIGLAVLLLINQVADQFADLGSTLSSGLREIRRTVVEGPLPISEQRLDDLAQATWERVRRAADPAAGASAALQGVGGALLAVVLLFFVLKDGTRMWGSFLRLFPERRRSTVDEAGRAGWSTLSRYVRGTMIVAAIDAVGIGIALVLIGVPLVGPLALLTFLGGFVPIIGATVAGAVATLVALVSNGPTDALLVLAAVIAVQQLEGNLLEPLIVGQAVKLHPAIVLLAVTAGTLLAGIAGAVVAVPIVAVLYRVGTVLLERGSAPAPAQKDRA